MGRASREKAARREAARKASEAQTRPPLWSSRAWKVGAASVGLILLGGLIALLALSSSETGGSSGGSLSAGSTGEGKVGSFTVADIDEQSLTRPAGKPGVLFFMAGWCGTCIPEAEALAEIKNEHGEDVEILAVSMDPSDTLDNIRSFIDITGSSSFPYHWDREGALTRRYEVRALDTTLVYDSRGRIVYRDAAPTDRGTLESALQEAGLS